MKTLYSTTYIFYRYTYEIQNLVNKKIRFFFFKFLFKSRLCWCINLDFLQFYFISAKIYNFTDILIINQIFTLKDKKFLIITFFKCRLCSCINLDLLPFLFHICQNIHFTKRLIIKTFKSKYFYFYFLSVLFFKPLLWAIRPCFKKL